MRTRSWIIAAASLLVVAISPAQAARLLEVHIEQDGQTVLTGMTADGGDDHPYVTWEKLKLVDLEPVGTFRKSSRGETNARLEGAVRISILHGGRAIADGQVVVPELTVVRHPGASRWKMAAGELERIREAAGIRPPPRSLWPVIALTLALAVLLALVGWMIREALRARPQNPP